MTFNPNDYIDPSLYDPNQYQDWTTPTVQPIPYDNQWGDFTPNQQNHFDYSNITWNDLNNQPNQWDSPQVWTQPPQPAQNQFDLNNLFTGFNQWLNPSAPPAPRPKLGATNPATI